jgi:hypothetical protein
MRFVLEMAPQAKIASVQGKQLVFLLRPAPKLEGTSRQAEPAASLDVGAGSGSGLASSSSPKARSVSSLSSGASPSAPSDVHSSSRAMSTEEVLSIFNAMEQARDKLLPEYGIEEWGLSQASLQDVFLNSQ